MKEKKINTEISLKYKVFLGEKQQQQQQKSILNLSTQHANTFMLWYVSYRFTSEFLLFSEILK